jgi:hypothetical protein
MATINDIGIPGVGSGILHPKHQNRWRVTFANMGGGADSQPISMQAITVGRPKITFAEVELHRYNSVAYVAGKHTWDPMTLTLQDDISGAASAVLQAQLQKQQWLIGAEGQWLATASEGSLYKFVTYLDMLDGNDQVVEKWTVEGCYLKEVAYGDLDYAKGDAIVLNVTIRFDHARQNITGYAGGPGIATGGAGTM